MAFDAADFTPTQTASPALVDDVLCPIWAAANPDRALAFLYVAPQDGPAVDALIAA